VEAEHQTTLDVVCARIGSTLTRIRRVHYEFQGTLDREKGDIELWFDDRVLWFRCASNGQDLRVEQEGWKDHFAPPLSPENEAFVRESGHEVAVDVSDTPPYNDLVKHDVDAVEPVVDQWQHLIGVCVRAGGAALRIYVDADELFVTPG
jgi:hypothetical protein